MSDLPAPSRRRPVLWIGSAAGLLLAALTVVVVLRGGAPVGWDPGLHRWFLDHRRPALTGAARVLTATGTGVPAYALAALAGALGGGRRRWWLGGLAAVGVLAGVQLLRLGLLDAIARPRPPRADWATVASGYAYPSGHTTTAAAVAVLVVVALCVRTTSRAARAWGTVAAGLWAIGVGLTRVYLGVHWPTDVLAGWLLVTALAGASEAVRRRLRSRSRL